MKELPLMLFLTAEAIADHSVDERDCSSIEVSIVMPCLNDADTLAICIEKAQRTLAASQINGEIIMADNGSTDGSPGIASSMGARIAHVAEIVTVTRL